MNNNLIENSILKSIEYNQYRQLIKELLAKSKSTGTQQTEDLLSYSILNDKRMDRLDKKTQLSETSKKTLNKLKNNYTLLVISESWCGDAAQIMPIINKISEESNKIDLKIVLRDENEELMNRFLTNGSKSIPKMIILNKENEIINTWGPRPSIATQMVIDYKNSNGKLDADFKKSLQLWYNKDKGQNIQHDILELFSTSKVEVG